MMLKYNGQVDEITPARISDELTKRVQMLTSAIYDILGCSGIIRVDYIITAGEKLNLLEVNTTPNDYYQFYSPASACSRTGYKGCDD